MCPSADLPFTPSPDVRNRIGLREAGSSVTLTYLREGRKHTATLVIAEMQ